MMVATDIVVQLIRADGLLLLFPLAVIEGPIVTIVAGWVGRMGYLPLGWAMLVLVLADLAGDSLLYVLGRTGTEVLPQKLRQSFGLTDAHIAQGTAHFSKHGGRTLIAAKLTHTFGFAVLVAAGGSRMSFPLFLSFNLVATIPKTLFFLLIGYAVGEANVAIGNWIWRVSLGGAILGVAIFSIWYWKNKRERR